MKTFLTSFPWLTCALGLLAPNAQADGSLRLELDAGAEYDSNVNSADIDDNSGQGDLAALANVRLKGQYQATERLQLSGVASYASKSYQTQDDYDLALPSLSVDASYALDPLTLGASHLVASASLGREPLLQLGQSSLYAGKLFDGGTYLRLAAHRKDKRFHHQPARDAQGAGWTADAFWFFNQGRSFVSLGVGVDREDAQAREFDARSVSAKGRWSKQFSLFGRDSRAQWGWRYLERDYLEKSRAGVAPALGAARADRQLVTDLSWDLALNRNLSTVSKLEYGRYRSNLATADYAEVVASLMVRAHF